MMKHIHKLIDEALKDDVPVARKVTFHHGKRKVKDVEIKPDSGRKQSKGNPVKAQLYADLPKSNINKNRSRDARALRNTLD